MKCIKKGDEIKRVENERAFTLVDQGWAFCNKSEWKKKGRVTVKVEQKEKVEKKSKNKKAKKAKTEATEEVKVETKTEKREVKA